MHSNRLIQFDVEASLPKDKTLYFSDLLFFRVMLDGLCKQGKIKNSREMGDWMQYLTTFVDIDDWVEDVDVAADSAYRLSLSWLHAAALAWYHNSIGSAKTDTLVALQVRLQLRYWQQYGPAVPEGWLSMLRRYQAPNLREFKENSSLQTDFPLFTAIHDLLVATMYLNKPLDLNLLFTHSAVNILKKAISRELSADVFFEILVILYGINVMSQQEIKRVLSVERLLDWMAPPSHTLSSPQRREYFHTQLLAQALLLIVDSAAESVTDSPCVNYRSRELL